MRNDRWWAWIVVYAAGTALVTFATQVVDVLGHTRAGGLYGVAGIALGWSWYRLYPRPLVERLRLVSLTILVLSVAALAVGAERADANVAITILPGVLAGLVLTETQWPRAEWRRQKETALSSRETMRDLR